MTLFTFRYSQTEFWFISACFAWNADTMLATLQRLWLCAEALLLCSQTASGHRVRHKQSYCTSYAPASSNLIFWSHGFHGNRAIVLTGNEEDCISSWGLVRYTTACVHTHTRAREWVCGVCDVIPCDTGVVLWGKGDRRQPMGHSRSIRCLGSVGWHLENCPQLVV